MPDALRDELREHLAVVGAAAALLPEVEAVADRVCAALAAGGRVFAFGNGGSAADAQHLAAELVGRFRRQRRPLAALALTTDSSVLTALGNDFAFEDAFARQVEALATAADVVIGITTSGESENVVRGLAAATEVGAATVALTGQGGGRAAELADHALAVPSATTARVQEVHLLFIHLISERVDAWAAAAEAEIEG